MICQPTAVEIITNKLNQMETEQLEAQISNKLPTNPENVVVIKLIPPPVVKAVNSPVKYSSVVSRNPVPRRIVPRPVAPTVPAKPAPAPPRRFPTSRPIPKPQSARNLPPSRNPPSNVANRISFRSKTMIDMGRQPPPSKPGSTKQSKEDVGSSSSTLKASNDNVSERSVTERRSEPKQLPSDTNDGWLTVKNRRRPSLHWANRFNQPTGYASLPTLALMNEKEKEKEEKKKVALSKEKEKPVKKVVKAKVNSLPSRPSTVPAKLRKVPPPPAVKPPPPTKQQQNLIKRQKSDLTGLKITSLHKEFIKSEKSNINIDRSTPALVEMDEVKPALEEDDDNEDLKADDKINIKIQTNRDFSKTIGELYESLSSLPNGIRNEILSSCPEECDEKDEIENEENQKKLLLEEEELERQIRELQNTEIDVDTETDETDIEVGFYIVISYVFRLVSGGFHELRFGNIFRIPGSMLER